MHTPLLQRLVESWECEGRVGADNEALPSGPDPVNDGEENLVPPISTVDVAWPELGGDAVAVLVEDEQRMTADGLEVAGVGRLLLRPVDRARGAVDIEGHAPGRRPGGFTLHQLRIAAREPVVAARIGEDLCLEPGGVGVSAMVVSLRSREASIRKAGSWASRSASLVSSVPARRL